MLAVDGRAWMFFGSLADGIHRIELAADGPSVKAGAKPVHVAGVRHPKDKMKRAWEGSYLHFRKGWWYLFVSGGHYGNHTYYLTVGRSRTVAGVREILGACRRARVDCRHAASALRVGSLGESGGRSAWNS